MMSFGGTWFGRPFRGKSGGRTRTVRKDDGVVREGQMPRRVGPFASRACSAHTVSDKTFKTLESSIQAWEKKVAERKAWCEEYGKAVKEGDVGRRNELDRVVPEKGYTAYPDANILDVFKGVVYLLKKRLEEHRQLEQRWVADGLSILWDTHMVPEKFRQDQGLQRHYQDLHHRALAVHHEPHYEATLPTSPDSYVEQDNAS